MSALKFAVLFVSGAETLLAFYPLADTGLNVEAGTTSRGAATWYLVRVAEATRESANKLCARLEAAGGACIVYRNSSEQK